MKIEVRLDGGEFRRIDSLMAAVRRRALERGEARRAARAEAETREREMPTRSEDGRGDGARR